LAHAQGLSRDLRAAPVPSPIGTIDPSIPPALAGLKHDIRNWLTSKIATSPADTDPASLEEALLTEIKKADLLADPKDHELHPFGTMLGLGISDVPAEPRLLRAVVSYDGLCPPDDSVLYFERRADDAWHLLLNFDNTDFENPWGDRALLYAGISPRDDRGRFFAFIVRTRSYCPESGSVWNSINYHVLRRGLDPESPQVVLSAEHEYHEEQDFRVLLGRDSVTMDFPGHVLKYAISDSTALQIEPIALTAEGFVEEWIALPWWSASDWSNPKNGTSLGDWHAQLHEKDGGQPFSVTCHFARPAHPIES
jgi:hypothetical protein